MFDWKPFYVQKINEGKPEISVGRKVQLKVQNVESQERTCSSGKTFRPAARVLEGIRLLGFKSFQSFTCFKWPSYPWCLARVVGHAKKD